MVKHAGGSAVQVADSAVHWHSMHVDQIQGSACVVRHKQPGRGFDLHVHTLAQGWTLRSRPHLVGLILCLPESLLGCHALQILLQVLHAFPQGVGALQAGNHCCCQTACCVQLAAYQPRVSQLCCQDGWAQHPPVLQQGVHQSLARHAECLPCPPRDLGCAVPQHLGLRWDRSPT